LLGWWGIPSGPIRTIQSIFVNRKAANSENYNEPTQEFIEFIKPHSAALIARVDKISDMKDVLKVIYPHDFD
jgi:hypothetical protein